MDGTCDKCGQPLPDQPRRDPPLPPLDHPAIVTIHDLPDPSKAVVEAVRHRGNGKGMDYTSYHLREDRP